MDLRTRAWSRLVLAGIVPPGAWLLFQQGLSVTLRLQCGAAGPPLGPLWGAVSVAACGSAAWLATRARVDGDSARFVRRAAQLAAGLFAVAIAFQTLATLIVPPCAR
ncbi:hypothetical protein [Sphingomonas sp. 3P27F8]|uniref:hypothetical protein n=1 Tax=Sphingomonas sp. 3P27F8 TaxID=2502213 RepID=UPI0010F90C39|nr:hypothetical protein [Sphingomonas sp. 3P27F8]